MRDLEEYFRPETPEEAVEIKNRFGHEAIYLAGGSDILVHRPRNVRAVIDIRHCGLRFERTEGDWHVIGGAARLCDVETSFGHLAGGMLGIAVRETAPWLIRNAATLVGNLVNASPAADSVPALLALDAELELLGDQGGVVPAGSILLGPHRTSLGNRLVRSIRIPRTAADRTGAFIKQSRSKSDIAQVNVAVTLRLDSHVARDVRVVVGAAAPTAIRAHEAETLLEGRVLDDRALAEVELSVRAEVRPISDWRASEEYRRRIAGVLTRRALERIVELNGKDEVA